MPRAFQTIACGLVWTDATLAAAPPATGIRRIASSRRDQYASGCPSGEKVGFEMLKFGDSVPGMARNRRSVSERT